jgi:hypothetical protein
LFKLTDLLRELPRSRVLEHVHREFSATGYVVGCRIAESDLAELAPVIGVGKYAALEFEEDAARRLRSGVSWYAFWHGHRCRNTVRTRNVNSIDALSAALSCFGDEFILAGRTRQILIRKPGGPPEVLLVKEAPDPEPAGVRRSNRR